MALISPWALRSHSSGPQVGDAQLKRYVDWGLLRPDADGKFDEADRERLTAILEAQALGGQILPRTVLRLAFDARFQIPAASLRRAAVAMAGPEVVRSPVSKLRRIAKAKLILAKGLGFWAWRYYRGYRWPIDEHTRVRVPRHKDWREIIRSPAVTDESFGQWVDWALMTDRMGIGAPLLDWPTEVVMEERLLGLLVLDLAAELAEAGEVP